VGGLCFSSRLDDTVPMPAYLHCTVTGEPVSPCYLDNGDAGRALGSSELLTVDTWMAGRAFFPKRQGLRRGMVVDIQWAWTVRQQVEKLMREFQAAVRMAATHPGNQGGRRRGEPGSAG
jgi:hypothetical protein